MKLVRKLEQQKTLREVRLVHLTPSAQPPSLDRPQSVPLSGSVAVLGSPRVRTDGIPTSSAKLHCLLSPE